MLQTLTRESDSQFPIDFDLVYHDELPFHQAISHGSMDAIRLLLLKQKRTNLEAHDRNGDTPLHLAVRSQSREVMDILLSHPHSDVNCRDLAGNTPLWLSTHLSCDVVTERLLEEARVNLNFVGGYGGTQTPSTSLHHAVLRPDTGALQRLVAAPGIDVSRCAAGQSPFALACAHGCVDAMRVLLHIDRVDINASGLGHPPICQAVEHGQVEAVRLLVEQGGRLQINRRTMTGADTALCIAARDGSLDLVRALLRHDQIDLNLKNRSCQGPLSLAAQRAHPNVVEALLLDGRLSRQSMTAALHTANNDSIRKLILTKIGDAGVRKLPRSSWCRFGAFQAGV
jgi:ankyrin repeat protein